MSAVKVIRSLLTANTAVTAIAPAARIIAGIVPQGTPLPAISVAEVGCPFNPKIGEIGGNTEATSRVQVTAQTKDYGQAQNLVRLARKACNLQRGTVAGIQVVRIVADSLGPDMSGVDPDDVFKPIDFMVTYLEAN
jgi:hypothetical protein